MNVDYICSNCHQKMRFNAPRLGINGGFVHADSGKFECDMPTVGNIDTVMTSNIEKTNSGWIGEVKNALARIRSSYLPDPQDERPIDEEAAKERVLKQCNIIEDILDSIRVII